MLKLVQPELQEEWGGPGHNSGAEIDWSELLDADAIRISLSEEHDSLRAKKIKLIKAFDNFKADHTKDETTGFKLGSEAQVAAATDLGAQMKELAKKVELTRKSVKGSFDTAVDTVQAFFRNIGEPLEKGAKAMEAAISAFNDQVALVRQREADEQAKRLRAEADDTTTAALTTMNPDLIDQSILVEEQAALAEKIAAGSFADFSRVRGDYAVSSGRETFIYEIENIDLVPREYLTLDAPKVTRSINAKGKDRVKAIPGLRIVRQLKTQIRS